MTEPETFRFGESGNIPNHPEWPVLLYRGVIDPESGALADAFEARYRDHGWAGSWRWSVYDFHHYHSNAHEVLGVASGEARLRLGGPDGKRFTVRAGDAIVLPAGTGHRNEGASDDFQVVGAYPKGQEDKDLIREDRKLDDAIRQRIRETPPPEQDPFFGEAGPLLGEWSR